MLPLVDQPIIRFIIHECISSGINNVVLVTNSSKASIENYLDNNFEITDILNYQNVVKDNVLRKNICCSLDINIVNVRQKLHKGIGQGNAILSDDPLIGNKPIATILPDIIICDCYHNFCTSDLSQMLDRFSNTHCSQILLKKINKIDITNYGIVTDYRVKNEKFNENIIEIIKIIEKPVNVESIASDLAVVDSYVFSHKIWDELKMLSSGGNKGMELTDAISVLITKEVVEGLYLKGLSYDCGNKLGYMQVFVNYGIHHKELGKDFKVWLQSLFSNDFNFLK